MKALTLTQPWASLVAVGAKRFETRSWSTRYTGQVAIHAATEMPPAAKHLCAQEPFRTVLAKFHLVPHLLPRGMVVAIADLVLCSKIAADLPACGLSEVYERGSWELAFGDFTPGRFAWHLHNAKPLDPPQRARGSLGLWTWGR